MMDRWAYESCRSVRASSLPDTPLFFTPQEAADCLRISKSFLDKLRVRGGGPKFIKVGNRVRYNRRDLSTWISSNEFFRVGEASNRSGN